MIGQNPNLKSLATLLEATRVKQEEVAKQIKAGSQDGFDREFAFEIVRRKLDLSRLSFEKFNTSNFPFQVDKDKGYLISIVHTRLLDDDRKSEVNMYCRFLMANYDDFDEYSGIIMCLPYLMNGNNLREQLSKQLPIGFVNLAYDANSLERRFQQYCLK